jgi:hypothetical protein
MQDWPAAVQSALPVQSFGQAFALWQIFPRGPKSQQSSPMPVLQSWSAVQALSHELAQTPPLAVPTPPVPLLSRARPALHTKPLARVRQMMTRRPFDCAASMKVGARLSRACGRPSAPASDPSHASSHATPTLCHPLATSTWNTTAQGGFMLPAAENPNQPTTLTNLRKAAPRLKFS